jgi:hypothetical protein
MDQRRLFPETKMCSEDKFQTPKKSSVMELLSPPMSAGRRESETGNNEVSKALAVR